MLKMSTLCHCRNDVNQKSTWSIHYAMNGRCNLKVTASNEKHTCSCWHRDTSAQIKYWTIVVSHQRLNALEKARLSLAAVNHSDDGAGVWTFALTEQFTSCLATFSKEISNPDRPVFENHPKCCIWVFQFRHFSPIFVQSILTCLVTLFGR